MSGSLLGAIRLLRDPNLVWSEDLESIRESLADLLELSQKLPSAELNELAEVVATAFTKDV